MERLSEREKDEIERLAAAGLPSRLIGQQIGRHHRTVWGHIARLRRPAVPEPLRLSLAEREEISRGLAGGESCARSRTGWSGHRRRSRVRPPRMEGAGGIGPVVQTQPRPPSSIRFMFRLRRSRGEGRCRAKARPCVR